MPIINRIAGYHDDMTAWRRDIHAHPETAFEEHRTAELVAKKLAEFGLEVTRGLAGTGVIGIRVLAGGALSGSAERHPIASPPPEPIGSAMRYDADIARARRLMPLIEEGFAASLTEAATRFAIGNPAVGTVLVGMATPQQFEDALAAVEKGPLPPAALERLEALRQSFAGEPR